MSTVIEDCSIKVAVSLISVCEQSLKETCIFSVLSTWILVTWSRQYSVATLLVEYII